MELFNKIKNKQNFIFSLVLLLSVTIIPSIKIPFKGNVSYLFFSEYSFVLGFLLISLVYLFAIADETWHIQSIKGALFLIWIFFILEITSLLIKYIDFFDFYNIFNNLQLGAYTDFALLIILTFKSLKFKRIENKTNF